MKRKQIIIGIIVIVCAGLGIYALVKSHGAAAAADEDEATPSVVTVQAGSLKRMTLHNYVSGYGTIEPAPATADEPAAGAQLAAPVAGVVTKINTIAGQQVKKGDVLVELNSGTATFDYATGEVERQKKLFAQQNTSLKNLQDAEAQLALLQVTAPLSGTVVRVNVKPGPGGGFDHSCRGSDGFEPAGGERANSVGGSGRIENRRSRSKLLD